MKNTFKIALALFMSVLSVFLCSCSKREEQDPGSIVTIPARIETPTPPAVTESPTLEPSAPPAFRSCTTGLSFDSEPEYHPIAVMIENSPAARPQTGLNQADIIYEMIMEGGMSRMMCLFNDQIPVEVGPVRSARIYFLNTQREWDCPIVHFGGPSDKSSPSYIYGSDMDYIKLRVDGLKGAWYKYFWRDSSRKSPHDVYTDLTKINDAEYNYTPEYRNQLIFDEQADYSFGTPFRSVTLSMTKNSSYNAEYVYDSATGRMLRYQDGKPFMSITKTRDSGGGTSQTEAQYSCKNLIVQYVNSYALPADKSNRRMVDVVGSGKCDFFINGMHISGSWERSSLFAPTTYYFNDGRTAVFAPGNTWITMQPQSGSVTIE